MKEIKQKPDSKKPKLLESAAKAPKTAMKDLWLKSKDKSIIETYLNLPTAKAQ